MKRFILSLVGLGLGACNGEPVPAVKSTQVFQVEQESTIQVKDGDTISINNESFRFRCIDAPESSQPLGKDSAQYLNQIIIDSGISMREVSPYKSYNRSLGVPYTTNNENISIMLLKEGLALVEPRYANCENMDRYYEAQRYAEQNKLGVWGLDNMIPPWDYRHSH